jgi:hypothetical protein
MLTASNARMMHVAHDYGQTKARIERLITIAATNANSVTVTVTVAEVNPITYWLTGLGYSVTHNSNGLEAILCVRW